MVIVKKQDKFAGVIVQELLFHQSRLGKTKTIAKTGIYSRVGKVEKLSNMSLIKVVDFWIIFDKKFV